MGVERGTTAEDRRPGLVGGEGLRGKSQFVLKTGQGRKKGGIRRKQKKNLQGLVLEKVGGRGERGGSGGGKRADRTFIQKRGKKEVTRDMEGETNLKLGFICAGGGGGWGRKCLLYLVGGRVVAGCQERRGYGLLRAW